MALAHADKWGPVGSIVAILCCLGVAPAVVALAALGLGFLLTDWILIPLLVVFLGVTLWALHRDKARHGRKQPEAIALLAAMSNVAGVLISSRWTVVVALLLLVAASVWNFVLIRSLKEVTRD